MKKVDWRVHSFLELCDTYPDSVDTLDASCRSALEAIGIPYYACCTHVDPCRRASAAVMMHSYPEPWVQHWLEEQLYQIDPVLKHAERYTKPFLWNDAFARHPPTREQKDVLADAAPFRLTGGFTVPITLPWMPRSPGASCSVVPDRRPLDQFRQLIVRRIAISLYVAASSAQALRGLENAPWEKLTPHERQGLILIARGCPEWRIGHLLGVGPNMAHAHIERQLGVSTPQQAVFRGLSTRQISLFDIF